MCCHHPHVPGGVGTSDVNQDSGRASVSAARETSCARRRGRAVWPPGRHPIRRSASHRRAAPPRHGEEVAGHRLHHVGERLHRRHHATIVAHVPVLSRLDWCAIKDEGAELLRQRREGDELSEHESFVQVLALQVQEPSHHACDRFPVRGRGDVAGLVSLISPTRDALVMPWLKPEPR
jgi:hypothetical protein